jgi:ATP/maltotriose-dependent transcriptional regulator MalT
LGDLERSAELKLRVVAAARDGEAEARLWLVAALADLSDIALDRGNISEARRLAEEAISQSHSPGQRTRALSSLASATLADGDLDAARDALLEVAEAWKGRHDYNYAYSLVLLGDVARRYGDGVGANAHTREALQLFAELRDVGAVSECLEVLGDLSLADGRVERAGRLLGAARGLRAKSEQPMAAIEIAESIPQYAVAEGDEMTLEEAVAYALTARD